MVFYYFETIKKYIIAFASLFDDLYIQKFNQTTQQFEQIKVPITFAPKSKIYDYLKKQRFDIATYLPRIAFVLSGMNFDPSRKKQTNVVLGIDKTNDKILLEGVPYNFQFDMTIWTKYYEDNLQLIEQITSQFAPDVSVALKEDILLQFERTIVIELENINFNINESFGDDEMRVIQSNLSFSAKGYIYPNIKDAKLIKQIDLSGYYKSHQAEQKVFEKLIE